MGIDVPDICWVIHVGMLWMMLDYVQESGCAGWDGQWSASVIVVLLFMGGTIHRVDVAEVARMQAYIDAGMDRKAFCWWVILELYLDAVEKGYQWQHCWDWDTEEEFCDRCEPDWDGAGMVTWPTDGCVEGSVEGTSTTTAVTNSENDDETCDPTDKELSLLALLEVDACAGAPVDCPNHVCVFSEGPGTMGWSSKSCTTSVGRACTAITLANRRCSLVLMWGEIPTEPSTPCGNGIPRSSGVEKLLCVDPWVVSQQASPQDSRARAVVLLVVVVKFGVQDVV
ncbi:hypothetical protein VTN02DRAFT_6789 [Thermoascus thermophilus]